MSQLWWIQVDDGTKLKWIPGDENVGCHGSRDTIDSHGCWGLVTSWLNWILGGDDTMAKVDPGA